MSARSGDGGAEFRLAHAGGGIGIQIGITAQGFSHAVVHVEEHRGQGREKLGGESGPLKLRQLSGLLLGFLDRRGNVGRVPGRRPGLQLRGMARRGHRRWGRAENDYENEERERSRSEEWPTAYTAYTERGTNSLTTKYTKDTKGGGAGMTGKRNGDLRGCGG